VREIRMLRAMRRELETGLRRLLYGHEGGNPGYSQGAAYGSPRQFPTLPPSAGAGERHLRRTIGEFVAHYHTERYHQGLGKSREACWDTRYSRSEGGMMSFAVVM